MLLTKAYVFEKAAKVALVFYLGVILSFVMDVYMIGLEIKSSDLIGTSIILSTFCLNVYKNFMSKSEKRKNSVKSNNEIVIKYGK